MSPLVPLLALAAAAPGDAPPARFAPFAADVEVARDLPYARRPGAEPNLTALDVYRPAAAAPPGGRPAVVFVHGGGWRGGDKANRAVVGAKPAHFCGRGWAFISVNYRLSPAVRHPAHAEDVAAAVAWVRANATALGVDPRRIVLAGHSAGAHLAALAGTDPALLAPHGMTPADLAGVVVLDTAALDPTAAAAGGGRFAAALYTSAFGPRGPAWDAASPRARLADLAARRDGPLTDALPPFLVVHTDRAAATAASEAFAAQLRDAGVPAGAVLAAGRTHASLNANLGTPGDAPTAAVDRFLDDPAAAGGDR